MLIEFSVGNFRSFKDRVTLSMEASKDDWLEESHVIEAGGIRLLKSAAIYGANASGKSNFLLAIRTFKEFILSSSKESQLGEKIPVVPFRLQPATLAQPTHFEVLFLHNGSHYRYGFEATTEAIQAEWLFRRKNSTRETRLFTRTDSKFQLSAEFREGKDLEARTRPNALFLSVVAQFNGEIAGEIFEWLKGFRDISGLDDGESMDFTAEGLQAKESGKWIRDLVRRADVGIEDLQVIKVSSEELRKTLPREIPAKVRKRIAESPNAAYMIKTYRGQFDDQGKRCGTIEFNLKTDESEGTKKFIALSGPFLLTLVEGSILSVDELEARFHPLLTKAVVELFNSSSNSKHAQLIYATHDEGLLHPNLVRRDQVWFVEKTEYGASHLYSLADFKVRKQDKFGKEYLLGQFGAVPQVSELRETLNHVR